MKQFILEYMFCILQTTREDRLEENLKMMEAILYGYRQKYKYGILSCIADKDFLS